MKIAPALRGYNVSSSNGTRRVPEGARTPTRAISFIKVNWSLISIRLRYTLIKLITATLIKATDVVLTIPHLRYNRCEKG